MKIRVLLLAIGCSIGQFGSGADSARCVENISLFIPYAKAGNFKDAYEFWKITYDECPAATKDIYLYGVRIVGWQIENEKDPAKKAALIDKLMAVYDQRIKYFGDDSRYGKDWIVSRKAQDYIQYMGDKADVKVLYGWLGEVITEFKEKTEALAVSYCMYSSHQQLLKDPNFKEQFIQKYLKCSAIFDTQVSTVSAALIAASQTPVCPTISGLAKFKIIMSYFSASMASTTLSVTS